MPTSQPITVKNLTKRYSNFTALDNVDFAVKRGEVFGYLGPNGAGKTTTIRIITGLSRPSKGSCQVFGQIPGVKKGIYNKIGVLFEEKNLYERLTGLQNLKFYANLYNVKKKRIINLLDCFGLIGSEKKKVTTYSKGMKQRLLICRTLLHKPELLILDEPTDGLDPNSAGVIIEAIKEFVKEGKTVLISSHNMDEVDEICNRVAFLKDGKIIDINNPDILKQKYGQAVLRVKIKSKVRNKLLNIIDNNDNLTDCGSDIYILDLYLAANPWSKLNKIKNMKENQIINVHSREASLKEVFKEITS